LGECGDVGRLVGGWILILGISNGGSGTGGTTGAGASVCVDEVAIFGLTFGVSTLIGEDSERVYSEFGVLGGVNGTSTVCDADDTMRWSIAGVSMVRGRLIRFLR
jgi:hypothetical protein